MKNAEFKKLMRQVGKECQPNENWVNNTRNLLMLKINQDLPESTQRVKMPFWLNLADTFVPKNLASHPVAVFSLILGLFLISSFASVNASRNTLPGDILYPVKITAENIKYNLSFSDKQKAKVAMSFVENRVDELKMIVEKEKNNGQQEKIVQTTKKIKNNLDIVKNKIKVMDAKNEDNEDSKIAETVKEIDEKLAVVEQGINEASQNAENEAVDELAQVAKEVEETSVVVLAVLEDEDNETLKHLNTENTENTEITEAQKQDGVVEGAMGKTATTTASSSVQTVETQIVLEQIFSTTSEIILPELIIEEIDEKTEEFKIGIGE